MSEATDDRRSQLVDRLWRLKQLLANQSGRYVHFNMLLNDPHYRRETIDFALSSNNQDILDLARRAHKLDMDGQLLSPPQGPKQPTRSPTDPAALSPAENAAGQRRPFPVGWALLLVILVVLLGSGVGLLQQDLLAPLATSQTVTGSIAEDTAWHADTTYYLEGKVFVERGVRLIIEPGTRILGNRGAALIVTREAVLYARGTQQQPIVFTSAQPPGERRRGDWGGLVLLGNAPVNRGTAHIEGIAKDEVRGNFGGDDPHNNCGLLNYVRLEFAGYEIGANNELNGLTLGGCGDQTIVRNVQVHRGLDDGVEVFGGTVDLRNIVVTGAGDDAFDWDMGWRGRVQFLVIQQYADDGDNGFEGDNWKSQPHAQPRSRPTFYNVTMIGSGAEGADQRAMTLRRGTGGIFRNFIIMGFPLEAIDIVGEATAGLIETGELDFQSLLMFDIGPNGRQFFSDEADDDGGLAEAKVFAEPSRNIRMGVNPGLSMDVFSPDSPSFKPAASSNAQREAASLPLAGQSGRADFEFWNEAATYLGAVRPGAMRTWMDRWTAFPVD